MIYKTIRIGKIKTSKVELVDITKAWLALSFAFAVALGGFSLISGSVYKIFSWQFIVFFAISLVTGGLGFLLHELAHKFSAQKFGCTAEFRAFDQMLYMAVGLAVFIGFIFAAPGAVMIAGQITRRENGWISAAGPLTNYVLAMIFLGLTYFFPASGLIFSIGFQINMWLGLFNMIPFGNFDGIKIMHWNRYLWGTMVIFGIFFLFIF